MFLGVRDAGVVRRKYEGEMGGDQMSLEVPILEVVGCLVQMSQSVQSVVFDRHQKHRLRT